MPGRAKTSVAAAAAACISMAAHGTEPLCKRWSEPVAVGGLDIALLPEASGIAISARGERLYHVNDGTRPGFFVTARDGGAPRHVRVSGFAPRDVEDLALGPCGDRTCLSIADVGDNAERRPSVQIAIVEEREHFAAEVAPLRVVEARYPDGPHNAEAVAIHPSGDLVLVSKTAISLIPRGPARVYRLRAAQLASGGVQTFEAVGTVPYAALTALGLPLRRVVTAMDFAPGGDRLVLLSYDSAVEVVGDFAAGWPAPPAWVEGSTHRSFRIAPLRQAEAVAYDVDGRSILYSTESVLGYAAPLIRQACGG
jgi:hypothetical protein